MEKKPDSCVFFKVISDLIDWEYKKFIGKLLFDFIASIDPSQNEDWIKRMTYESRWNEESGLGMFKINERYIGHLKMYLYDEKQHPYEMDRARSIVFRDHYSERDVEKVYLVADNFEIFLKERGVEFERNNRMR